MDGYWRQPEVTAETLRNGWLHTGDVGRFDKDNFLYLTDRKKDMVITGGFNIYPREVEDAVVTHPEVAAAAVIGVPDPKWGEAVTAFVVRTPGATVTSEGSSHSSASSRDPCTPRRVSSSWTPCRSRRWARSTRNNYAHASGADRDRAVN